MRRRDFVGAAAALACNSIGPLASAQSRVERKGRLKQTVMTVVFGPNIPMDEMCRHAADLGVKGIDTVPVESWPTLKRYGLIPTMGPTGGVTFRDGLIRKELHNSLEKSMRDTIDLCA